MRGKLESFMPCAPYGLWPVRYHALGLQALADSLACRAVPRFVPARAF